MRKKKQGAVPLLEISVLCSKMTHFLLQEVTSTCRWGLLIFMMCAFEKCFKILSFSHVPKDPNLDGDVLCIKC